MNTPSRLSQPAFERFRSTISNAADVGRTVEVTSTSLAPTTLAARLRDALLSYRKFHWGDTVPNVNWTSLSVYTDIHGKVYLGKVPPNAEIKDDSKGIQIIPNNISTAWTDHELRALCLLISNHRISGGITIPTISPLSISTLELDYDIAITSTNDASIIF